MFSVVWGVSRRDNIESVNPNENVASIRAMTGFANLDILFLGASYTYRGVDAAMVTGSGYNAYNIGVSAGGPAVCELLLDDYVATTGTTPRLVIMGVSLITFSRMTDNWKAYAIHRFLNRPLSNESIALRFNALTEYPNMVSRSFRKSMSSVLAEHETARFDTMKTAIAKSRGFRGNPGRYTDSVFAGEREFFLRYADLDFRWDKFERYESLIAKMRQRGIPVVLHQPPTSILERFLSEEFKADYAAAVARLHEECAFIEVHDPRLEDQRYFANTDHMNIEGARLYTAGLLKELARLDSTGVIDVVR